VLWWPSLKTADKARRTDVTDSIDYTLTLSATEAATGFFKAVPGGEPDLDQGLALLRTRPMDEFLHRWVLDLLAALPMEETEARAARAVREDDRLLLCLACEALVLARGPAKAFQYVTADTLDSLADLSPLVLLRPALRENRRLHSQWISLFRDNILRHRPLPSLEASGLPPLCSGDCAAQARPSVQAAGLVEAHRARATPGPAHTPEQTAALAMERLLAAGVDLDPEMRHESSLSPFALLRRWRFRTRTHSGRNRFTLSGVQTSYGKGLTLEDARVSLAMEIVERCSSFATVEGGEVRGYARDYPLVRASYRELVSRGEDALDPAGLSPESCYRDQPLHWIRGCRREQGRETPVLIPVQSLFLFVNLDETGLYQGLGSTGLASGRTLAQARVSALLEVIERHQEATVPFHPSTCFHLVADQEPLAKLLASYRALGIHLQFQDITPASGIPCCKCFVRGTDGLLRKGTSAHLDARRAIVSAMTETPYPFPKGPPSALPMENLLHVNHGVLPDYTTGGFETDLDLLENLLAASGYRPCYVDLTRRDIGLPVVKAVIPGMDVAGDFDTFSRVHPDLFRNYLALAGTPAPRERP
jgi:ribosomal protein S12 methylthiotransferase accessory factor YcaO